MKNKRQEQIERILNVQKEASVLELASMLKVSDMTIRRDLVELEKRGIISRYHGGAIISAAGIQGILPVYHPESCIEEKRAIGLRASQYLRELLERREITSVMLLSGSTMFEMVNAIDYTIPVMVVTDNLSIGHILSQNANNSVLMFGGKIYPPTLSVNGFLTEQMLDYLSADCIFTGMSAIDENGGLYCYDDGHASFLQKLLGISHRVIVLADYSKMGSTGLVKVGYLDEKFEIITDPKASKECLHCYEKLGVKIIT